MMGGRCFSLIESFMVRGRLGVTDSVALISAKSYDWSKLRTPRPLLPDFPRRNLDYRANKGDSVRKATK